MPLTISYDNAVNDPLVMGLPNVVAAVFAMAEYVIAQGDVFIIQQEYANAQPDLVARITTLEELHAFRAAHGLAL